MSAVTSPFSRSRDNLDSATLKTISVLLWYSAEVWIHKIAFMLSCLAVHPEAIIKQTSNAKFDFMNSIVFSPKKKAAIGRLLIAEPEFTNR
jgi:hypothetical protein